MKHLRGRLIAGLSLASLVVSMPNALAATASAGDADGPPHLLTELRFHSTIPMAAAPGSLSSSVVGTPGWSIGAQNGGTVGVQSTSSPDPSATSVDALEGSYPVPVGGQYVWADYNLPHLTTNDIYIEFWAKMPGQYKGGCKFLKVFGQRSQGSTGYGADATIATDYTGVDYGSIRQVSFGDGTTLGNDSQNVINLNGTNPQWIGRSYGIAAVQTPQTSIFASADWGTSWHHFRVHVKFNDGTTLQNQVANGEFYLEIDGKVYADATGLYNRNPADGPISYVELFGWSQTQIHPFQLWYYDFRISTGGFMPDALPDPPADPQVK